jgi:hypothetical protein
LNVAISPFGKHQDRLGIKIDGFSKKKPASLPFHADFTYSLARFKICFLVFRDFLLVNFTWESRT